MTRKAKQATPTTEAKQEPKQQEKPKQAAPTEAKQQPKEQAKQQQPTKKLKPRTPSIKRITMEYFMKFNTSSNNRKSWIKETIERATKEPVMVKNLTRGQIMALINQVNRHNISSEHKIAYKYDVKRGIVLLAPEKAITQMEGEQK